MKNNSTGWYCILFCSFLAVAQCSESTVQDDAFNELPKLELFPMVAPDDHIFQDKVGVPILQLQLLDENEDDNEEDAEEENNNQSDTHHSMVSARIGKLDKRKTRIKKKKSRHKLQSWMIPSKQVNKRTEVAVATSVSKSGGNHIMGSHCFEGMMLYIKRHNKMQNNGKVMLRMYSENDESNIIKAKKNIDFLKKNSPIFLGLLGDEIVREVMPYFIKNSLINLFPICGGAELRELPYRNQIYFRPSHKKEIELLISYAIKILRKDTFGIVHEDSLWGKQIKDEFVDELEKQGLEPTAIASYPEGTVSVATAVKKMTQKAPGIIFCAAHARPATVFIRWALNRGLYKSIFFGLSELAAIQNAIRQLRGIEVITSSVVPDPELSAIPLVAQFRDDMRKNLPHRLISPFFLEGYINGRLFAEVMGRMKPPFTTMKLIKIIEGFKEEQIDGLGVSFDEKSRTLSSQAWINQGKGKPYLSKKEIEVHE